MHHRPRSFCASMADGNRPKWAAKFGPIPRPDNKVSLKTRQNRKSLARARNRTLLKPPSGLHRPSEIVPPQNRKRAPKAGIKTLVNTVVNRHESYSTKAAFSAACGGIAVYAGGTRKVEAQILADLKMVRWSKGAALCPHQGLQTFFAFGGARWVSA